MTMEEWMTQPVQKTSSDVSKRREAEKRNRSQARDKEAFKKEFEKQCDKLKNN